MRSARIAGRGRWWLLLVLFLGAAAGCVALRGDNARTAFANPHVADDHGSFFGYLSMRLFGDDEWARIDPARYQTPVFDGPVPTLDTRARVTWVGHATLLIEYRGLAILTDPIWSKRASPLSFIGPARFSEPGIAFEDLPPIDAVVISHDHYDHLDRATIRRLGDAPMYFVPMRVDEWLQAQGISPERTVALDWWQSDSISVSWQSELHGTGAARFTALPAQHFSGRGITGRNQTQWASWQIEVDDLNLFFGGDTGYNPIDFREIGERFGPFDLGIIPVGAYRPRSFMKTIHVNPEEALRIHQDIRAHTSMGMHWGAFMLAAEHPEEVQRDLAVALAEAGVAAELFETWAVGETRVVDTQRGEGESAAEPAASARAEGVHPPVDRESPRS